MLGCDSTHQYVITPHSARGRHNPLVFNDKTRFPRAMDEAATDPDRGSLTAVPAPVLSALTAAGRAALDEAAVLARQASAPATLRAYRSDWAHYAAWCERMGFVAVPAAPAVVGAYLASLTDKAPTTIRRRLAALAKMHRFNDLPWNAAHRDIRGPLEGLLRTQGRPVVKAAPLTLDLLLHHRSLWQGGAR